MAKGKAAANSSSGNKSANASKVNLCALGQDGCKKPTGKISWVCCDHCSEWYHCSCVKVNAKEAAEIIFHCKTCQPIKEEEYSELQESIKTGLTTIVKGHALLAASPIARKCFATKAKSTEYNDGEKGVAIALQDILDMMDKNIKTVDHLKKMAEVMFDRMANYLKPEHENEISKMAKDVEKLLGDLTSKKKVANNTKKNNVTKPKEEKKVENKKTENKKVEDKKAEDKKVEPKKAEDKKAESKKADDKKVEPKKADDKKAEPKKAADDKKVEPKKVAEKKRGGNKAKDSETSEEINLKCENCQGGIKVPVYQCVDNHIICNPCSDASERGYCPICRNDFNKNRRMKKHDKWSTVKKIEEQTSEKSEPAKMEVDEDAPIKAEAKEEEELKPLLKEEEEDGSEIPDDISSLKVEIENEIEALAELTKKAEEETLKSKPTRKRRAKNAEPTEGETAKKAPKLARAANKKSKEPAITKAENKKIEEKQLEGDFEMEDLTKITPDSAAKLGDLSELDSLFASGGPSILPKSVLLPTSPAAVQNIVSPKAPATPPQAQVAAVQAFQLRPTATSTPANPSSVIASQVAGLGSSPQLRLTSPTQPQLTGIRPQGLQFFKIVEGKPVKIGGSAIVGSNAPTSSGIQPSLPTSPLPIQPSGSSAALGPKLLYLRSPGPAQGGSSSGAVAAPTRPQVAQKQIILLSNKAPGKAHILTPVSPPNSQGIVKLVSTGGNATEGGKILLAPNVARVAPQLQGPVLLRPVGAPSLTSAPLSPPQLPNVPLPRAALNSSPTPNNAQSLLPKSPLPPVQMKSSPTPSVLPSSTTTQKPAENALNKAFVWKNSDRTQFKLSARFNFDLFREYQKAHPNKDIRFALASIVTEDKSNEFSFHLSQQKEPVGSDSFWQLGVRAKNVSEHVWHLKVKVDPPVFLVNNGTFKQATSNFRIPKDISDRAVVDYELLLMGKLPAVVSAGPTVASAAAKSSRIVKKTPTTITTTQLQQKQQ